MVALTDFSPKQFMLDLLKKNIETCKKCALHKERTSIVFGSGNTNADIMLLGEAPGEEEDEKGVPFVGKAGKKLMDDLMPEAELHRDEVYITNTVCCRPPNNRTPLLEEEIAICWPRLALQIALIRPNLIICMGATATKAMIPDFQNPLGQYVNKLSDFDLQDFRCKLFITYHPSYLLKSPGKTGVAKSHWKSIGGIKKWLT